MIAYSLSAESELSIFILIVLVLLFCWPQGPKPT